MGMGEVISVGWDTGLNTACVWLESLPGQRPRFLGKREIRVGHEVTLAKPRRYRRQGGIDRIQKTETIVDDDDLARLHAEVSATIRDIEQAYTDYCDVIMVVEKIRGVSNRDRFGPEMARNLAESSWIGAEVAAVGRSIFGATSVYTATEAQGRKLVIGTRAPPGMSEDQAIATIIPLAIDGWPAKSNPDVRDAAVAALWGIERARMVDLRDRINGAPVGGNMRSM